MKEKAIKEKIREEEFEFPEDELEEGENNYILSYLKNNIVDIEDLKRIEKNTKIKVENDNYLSYKELVENINLVYEVFKYSKNVDGKINLLEVIYKFEGIFHSDITTLIIKVNNKYFTNIHIYVPISKRTFEIVDNDLQENIKRIKEKEKKEVIDYSKNNINENSFRFIKNDRIVGKLVVPLYVKKRKLGQLIFYYLDYRRVRGRE